MESSAGTTITGSRPFCQSAERRMYSLGVRMSKRAIQRNQEITSYAAALELENRGQALLTRSADMPEALAALRQKRPAVFTGA